MYIQISAQTSLAAAVVDLWQTPTRGGVICGMGKSRWQHSELEQKAKRNIISLLLRRGEGRIADSVEAV
jgi:hypothetical protein